MSEVKTSRTATTLELEAQFRERVESLSKALHEVRRLYVRAENAVGELPSEADIQESIAKDEDFNRMIIEKRKPFQKELREVMAQHYYWLTDIPLPDFKSELVNRAMRAKKQEQRKRRDEENRRWFEQAATKRL